MSNWQRNRMAAEHEPDISLLDEGHGPDAEIMMVGGIAIAGSFGRSDDADWLPAGYLKQFASATPTPRVGYDPAIDLATIGAEPEYRDAYLGAPILTLMKKSNKANHIVSANGDSLPSGGSGGGNGGGAAKKIRRTKRLIGTGDAEIIELPDTRLTMDGFTPAIREFYFNRQQEVRHVLAQAVALAIIEGRRPISLSVRYELPKTVKARTIVARGLNVDQKLVLHHYAGIGRVALFNFAYGEAAAQIVARDGFDLRHLIAAA